MAVLQLAASAAALGRPLPLGSARDLEVASFVLGANLYLMRFLVGSHAASIASVSAKAAVSMYPLR